MEAALITFALAGATLFLPEIRGAEWKYGPQFYVVQTQYSSTPFCQNGGREPAQAELAGTHAAPLHLCCHCSVGVFTAPLCLSESDAGAFS